MLVLSTMSACINSEQDSAGSLDASILVVSFEELVEESDLVAHVTIGNKIGERNEPSPKSIFEITINEVYKGDEAKKSTQTTVYQLGNDLIFAENRFAFSSSEEYILFMKETVGVDDSEYWILNEHAGLFKFTEDNEFLSSTYIYEELDTIKMDDSSEVEQQTFDKKSFILKIEDIKKTN